MSTLHGFSGSFYALNKRAPTLQEIFDEGVAEGKRRSTAPTTATAPVLRCACGNIAETRNAHVDALRCKSCWTRFAAPPANAPVASDQLAFESALSELVNKIDTGLDSGDLLIDARRASDALDAILTKGDLVANAYDYFRELPGRYENSIEFRIGWNACLDALGSARAALLAASMGGDKS